MKSKILLHTSKVFLIIAMCIIGFVSSSYILNFVHVIIEMINGGRCDYKSCSLICCEDDLIYIIYSIIFVALSLTLHVLKKYLFFIAISFFYIGLVFGTFIYKIAISSI